MDLFKRLLCCTVFFYVQSTYAWWEAGHMLVANIAYHHLNADAKRELKRLLHNMSVESTQRNSYEYDDKHPNYTMMAVSVWADNLYAYPNYLAVTKTWHYIQHAYSADGTAIPSMPTRDNVVWAVRQLRNHLSLKQANDYDRSRSLAYVIHFVGDIHQPLHCGEHYSAKLPDGDRGGNDYKINFKEDDGEVLNNLHTLWDSGIKLYPSKGFLYNVSEPKDIEALTKIIMSDYPQSYFASKAKVVDPDVWENESHLLAIDAHNIPFDSTPTDEYLNKNTAVVEQQIALAGYRLAHVLNMVLK